MVNVEVNIDERQVQHINNMLYQTPDKAKTVFRNAISRGMAAGKVQARKEIRERYDITTSNIKKYEKMHTRYFDEGDAFRGEISFRSQKIPLYRFNPHPSVRKYTREYAHVLFTDDPEDWRRYRKTSLVSAADVRGSMRPRPAAFIATFNSGHTGIFSRTGKRTSNRREKLREYWGFSVADMLDYPEAREAVQKRAEEITAKRLDHELMRMLNGYGTR